MDKVQAAGKISTLNCWFGFKKLHLQSFMEVFPSYA